MNGRSRNGQSSACTELPRNRRPIFQSCVLSWCPQGRKSLDGPIPARYQLVETPSASYLQRTEWNVRDHDGTVVFTLAAAVTGGSLRTIGFAKKHGKPCLHLSRDGGLDQPAVLKRFVAEHGIRTLNVAGSRESKEPGLHDWVVEVLEKAFFRGQDERLAV